MTDEIYVNAIGVEFRLDVGVSLAAATAMEIHVRKPSGTTVKWTATRYLTTNKITYTTQAGDLNEYGTYVLQAYVEFGSNSKHHGLAVEKEVYNEFEVVE